MNCFVIGLPAVQLLAAHQTTISVNFVKTVSTRCCIFIFCNLKKKYYLCFRPVKDPTKPLRLKISTILNKVISLEKNVLTLDAYLHFVSPIFLLHNMHAYTIC